MPWSRRCWTSQSPPVGVAESLLATAATRWFRRPPVWLGRLRKGRREIARDEAPTDRIRRPGGGRPRIQQDQPDQAALEALVDPPPAATRPTLDVQESGEAAAALTSRDGG